MSTSHKNVTLMYYILCAQALPEAPEVREMEELCKALLLKEHDLISVSTQYWTTLPTMSSFSPSPLLRN